MTTALNRPVTRLVSYTDGGGRPCALVVRITREGVWMKLPCTRWTSALLLPWSSAHMRAAWLKAEQTKRERAAKRRARQENA